MNFVPPDTCLQDYQKRRSGFLKELIASTPNVSLRGINPVNLKNMLGQIQSDRRNLAHGWFPVPGDSTERQLGTSMPKGGHPPPNGVEIAALFWGGCEKPPPPPRRGLWKRRLSAAQAPWAGI